MTYDTSEPSRAAAAARAKRSSASRGTSPRPRSSAAPSAPPPPPPPALQHGVLGAQHRVRLARASHAVGDHRRVEALHHAVHEPAPDTLVHLHLHNHHDKTPRHNEWECRGISAGCDHGFINMRRVNSGKETPRLVRLWREHCLELEAVALALQRGGRVVLRCIQQLHRL
eukprot:COSAG01_NODE_18709_length_1058_cov_1.755996_1_plen_169_part_10